LHDHFLKELASHPHRASAYISSITAELIFLLSLRFRRDCKGRNFILNHKIYLKFFFFMFSLISQFKLALPPYFMATANRCSLAEWCKDREQFLFLPSFPSFYFLSYA